MEGTNALWGCRWAQVTLRLSDFSSGHGEICPPHGRSTWRPADQPTTRRSTWISCMVFFKRHQEVHVHRPRSPCASACCGLVCGWIAHVGDNFRHGLLEKSQRDRQREREWVVTRPCANIGCKLETQSVSAPTRWEPHQTMRMYPPNLHRDFPWEGPLLYPQGRTKTSHMRGSSAYGRVFCAPRLPLSLHELFVGRCAPEPNFIIFWNNFGNSYSGITEQNCFCV